jgi:hypothetical protein
MEVLRMWHPQVFKKQALMAAILCLAAPGLARAQMEGSNVARVSYVQGSVQLLAGPGSEFEQAVINMPILDNSRLQTGNDGQVEVEFGDGSVARLTPNSSLQFDHLGQDRVQLQQLGGLNYYEFNVGDGHPPFSILFGDKYVQPTENAILRVGLDQGWDVAVMTGSVSVEGPNFPATAVAQGQSIHPAENGAPFMVSQDIAGDSWDNWNQDRDQAIAQEAAQQTPVRDDSANPQSENWNDLDAYGNWYPVDGNNVWVPSGVDASWDPYGAGYWGYYPTLGYTWISAYPWGWLPYHCGAWNYYSFGWGWAPGGCGRAWSPVVIVRNHPPGWAMPVHPPLYPPGGSRPLPGRLVAVDRGPAARGPWAFHQGPVPRPDHQAALNWNGRAIAPVQRTDVRGHGFVPMHGTGPGVRATLAGTPIQEGRRVDPNRTYTSPNRGFQPQSQMARPVNGPAQNVRPNPPVMNSQPNMPVNNGRPNPPMMNPAPNVPVNNNRPNPPMMNPRPVMPSGNGRPNVGYAPGSFNQRSNYDHQPMPNPPHYSPPPQQRMGPSMPPSHMAPPSGGGPHR